MKTRYIALLILFVLQVIGHPLNARQLLSPLLQEKMETAENTELIPVIIVFNSTTPKQISVTELDALPKKQRQVVAAREIRSRSESMFTEAWGLLGSAERNNKAANLNKLEMAQSVSAHVTPDVISELLNIPRISFIGPDKRILPEEMLDLSPTRERNDLSFELMKRSVAMSSPEWPLTKIRAPKVWNEFGVTGTNTLVAVYDTGCDYTHSDLQNHMWDGSNFDYEGQQLNYHGWDFIDDDNDPMDDNSSHGTLSSGIVGGDGTGQRQTGVASGTEIMCIRMAGFTGNGPTSEGEWLGSFDFFEDMINEYGSAFELPDILTMSATYGFTYSPTYAAWRNVTDNLLALGIVHTNSSGNQGYQPGGECENGEANGYPIPWNIGAPGNSPSPWMHPDQPAPTSTGASHVSSAISVGATDSNDDILIDSGQGPVAWENIQDSLSYPCQAPIPNSYWDYQYDTAEESNRNALIKPDLTAPSSNQYAVLFNGAEKIYSTKKGGGYLEFSKTSAATPHVAGTAALILSVNNSLTPANVDKTLQLTAVPLGPSGKDIRYGSGRIDAYEAVKYTLENYGGEVGQTGNILISEEMTIQEPVTIGFWEDVTVAEDINLASGSSLTLESKSGNITISASSGTVTIGGSGGASKIVGGNSSGNDGSGDDGTNETTNPETSPEQYTLSENYPNPFNPTTVISYQLPEASQVTLKIFDLLGREVATLVNSRVSAGQHEVRFDASNLSSGLYIYRLQAGEFIQTKKMMLIK